MKNTLFAALGLIALSASAFSQTTTTTKPKTQANQGGPVQAQSFDYSVTTTGINLLYLRDGFDNLTALSVPYFTFPNTAGRLSANAIGAADMNNLSHKVYAGTGLNYHIPVKGGYGIDLVGGLKGFDLANLASGSSAGFSTGKGSWVFGIGISIPIGSK